MRFAPPMPASVVKREEKSDKLQTFIAASIARLVAAGTAPALKTVRLITRSAESPVARTLVAQNADLVRAGIDIVAIFANLDPETTGAGWTLAGTDMPLVRELRFARNPRLLDVHELLVIGTCTTWIGDSMRRDPEKRDSFESYVTDCEVTAHRHLISFERISALCEPLTIRRLTQARCRDAAATKAAGAQATTGDLSPIAALPDPQSDFLAGTRH